MFLFAKSENAAIKLDIEKTDANANILFKSQTT